MGDFCYTDRIIFIARQDSKMTHGVIISRFWIQIILLIFSELLKKMSSVLKMDVETVSQLQLGIWSSEKNFSGVHTLEKSYLAVNFATLKTVVFLAPKVGNIIVR